MKLYITYGEETGILQDTPNQYPKVFMVNSDKDTSIKLAKRLAGEDKWYSEGLSEFGVVEVEDGTMFLEGELSWLHKIFNIDHEKLCDVSE